MCAIRHGEDIDGAGCALHTPSHRGTLYAARLDDALSPGCCWMYMRCRIHGRSQVKHAACQQSSHAYVCTWTMSTEEQAAAAAYNERYAVYLCMVHRLRLPASATSPRKPTPTAYVYTPVTQHLCASNMSVSQSGIRYDSSTLRRCSSVRDQQQWSAMLRLCW